MTGPRTDASSQITPTFTVTPEPLARRLPVKLHADKAYDIRDLRAWALTCC